MNKRMSLSEVIDAFDAHWEGEVRKGIESRFDLMERMAIAVFAQWIVEEFTVTQNIDEPARQD